MMDISILYFNSDKTGQRRNRLADAETAAQPLVRIFLPDEDEGTHELIRRFFPGAVRQSHRDDGAGC